jgi:hypothetical protein
MRDYQHPWNLRRIFGSQPVGCVGNQSRPEAGIAALVIPAQSSRWTVRGQGDGFWLLPTCRIWSWMTTGVPARALCSGHSSGDSCTFNTNVEGSDSICASRTRQALPGWRSHPNVSSAVTASNRLVAVKSLSH